MWVHAFLVFHDERTSDFVELDVADVIVGGPVAIKTNEVLVPCPGRGGCIQGERGSHVMCQDKSKTTEVLAIGLPKPIQVFECPQTLAVRCSLG